MKPFWISCIVLVGLFGLIQWNVHYLKEFITPLHDKLTLAEECVEQDDWETAQELTQEVHDAWKEKQFYLHVTMRHADLDQVFVLVEQATAYLEHKKAGEYAAVNRALIGQLDLLIEMEGFALQNVL